MRKFLLGVIVALICFWGYQYVKDQFQEKEDLQQASNLIEQEIKNVSKLVVSEGSYAKVYNYENTESFVFKFLSARKKALVVVNAKANVSYDLREMKYEVDAENKLLKITQIPIRITIGKYYLIRFKNNISSPPFMYFDIKLIKPPYSLYKKFIITTVQIWSKTIGNKYFIIRKNTNH